MSSRYILKRLSNSDLTIFASHFRNTQGAKQKAINLDKAVFIDVFYPSIPKLINIRSDRIPIDLWILGPGNSGPHNIQRKILKQQKNWRLDGELIFDPPAEPGRYKDLSKGDLCILDFTGYPVPTRLRMHILSRQSEEDIKTITSLEETFGQQFSTRKGMAEIGHGELSSILERIEFKEDHPILDILEESDIEDAALGGYEGKKKLLYRQKTRSVNPQDFENARKAAEKSGYEGEELLNELFDSEVNSSLIKNYRWVSKENAISPYDFILDEGESTCCKVDAKTTIGPFENKIHVSMGELYEMANPQTPYRIYRIYELKADSAKFRISENLREFAKRIIEKIEQLQDGINVDSVSIDPNLLDFEPEQAINF